MQILENISLLPYNTFRMDVRAEKMAIAQTREDLEAVSELLVTQTRPTSTTRSASASPDTPPTADIVTPTITPTIPHDAGQASHLPPTTYPLPPNTYPLPPTPYSLPLILGGGSNILFTRDVSGWMVKNEIRGIEVVREDEDHVYVKAGAGENWHRFVLYCIDKGWAGLENLSLIPGNTGASPMQNIGAYGVEIKDVFHSLEAWHIQDRQWVNFSHDDCQFGYRESVFKRQYRNQFVIASVTYRLNKKPVFHTSYGAIQQELEAMGVTELSIQAISDAVIRIRSTKLPDPAKIGNAGSFFKNPEIPAAQFEALKQAWPGIVGYPLPGDRVKLAAGWLIEKAGWKGARQGDAGCHDKQALVLVNYGQATGSAIYELSESILQDVRQKFGVELEREVNIY